MRVFRFRDIFANASWTSSHPPLLVLVLFCNLCFRVQGFGRFRVVATQQRNPSPAFVGGWCCCFFCFDLIFFGPHNNLTLFISVFVVFCRLFWVGGFFLSGLQETPPQNKATQPQTIKYALFFSYFLCFWGCDFATGKTHSQEGKM